MVGSGPVTYMVGSWVVGSIAKEQGPARRATQCTSNWASPVSAQDRAQHNNAKAQECIARPRAMQEVILGTRDKETALSSEFQHARHVDLASVCGCGCRLVDDSTKWLP